MRRQIPEAFLLAVGTDMNWSVLMAALAVVITLVVTASAIHLPGIGTALRGRVAGGVANLLSSRKAVIK